jgi:hypothetical protein
MNLQGIQLTVSTCRRPINIQIVVAQLVALILMKTIPFPECEILYQFTEAAINNHTLWSDNNHCLRNYTIADGIHLILQARPGKLFTRRAAACKGVKICSNTDYTVVLPYFSRQKSCRKCLNGTIVAFSNCFVYCYY